MGVPRMYFQPSLSMTKGIETTSAHAQASAQASSKPVHEYQETGSVKLGSVGSANDTSRSQLAVEEKLADGCLRQSRQEWAKLIEERTESPKPRCGRWAAATLTPR